MPKGIIVYLHGSFRKGKQEPADQTETKMLSYGKLLDNLKKAIRIYVKTLQKLDDYVKSHGGEMMN